MQIILGEKYQSYKKALDVLDLETLDSRRKYLCLKFAQKYAANEKTKHMFSLNNKLHNMETRKGEKFRVQKANTDRLKNSAMICMQNLLNMQQED